jgi:hypothetical protein
LNIPFTRPAAGLFYIMNYDDYTIYVDVRAAAGRFCYGNGGNSRGFLELERNRD